MFLFKKTVSQFLMPLAASSILLLVGLALLWFARRRQTLGKVLVSLGLALLLVCSYGWPTATVLRPLERTYPMLDLNQPLDPAPEYVMVLGAGSTADPELAITSQLNDTAVVRLVEGIRIYRACPGSKLIVSGGDYYDIVSHAELQAQLARELGVPDEDIIMLTEPDDTEHEAADAAEIVGDAPMVLVTSASHMRRALAIFQAAGMDPVPAPTGHVIKDSPKRAFWPGSLFPEVKNLDHATTAVYEYLGYLWSALRGKL